MKYIFVAGAPGSKWSSVVKNVYYSSDIDQSDYNNSRTYWHDASGTRELMHLGAYFDPGMESDLPEDFANKSKQELEAIFDSAFAPEPNGIRIIKSHIFSDNIDFLRETWPECSIALVYRSDDACLGWWVKCGQFEITYPRYHKYYKDLKTMAKIIRGQNAGIKDAWVKYWGVEPVTNRQLAQALNIELPPEEYQQDYIRSDIRVKVI